MLRYPTGTLNGSKLVLSPLRTAAVTVAGWNQPQPSPLPWGDLYTNTERAIAILSNLSGYLGYPVA